MADDKLSDSHGPHDESDESTPLAPELSETAEIGDRAPRDGYADDPTTPDINEAELDRATDAVSDHDHDEFPLETGDGDDLSAGVRGSDPAPTSRRPRSSRPVRRASRAEIAVDVPRELTEVDDAAESADLEPTPTTPSRHTVARKSHGTAGRGSATGARPTPVAFVSEAVGELRKVVWPTANQVQQYFLVVLVFVLFIILFVSLLDLGLGWALLKVFG